MSEIAPWPPTKFTPPLSTDHPSAAKWLLPVVRIVWRVAFNIALEEWQERLIWAVLEVFPRDHPRAGQLRFRQVVISLGRQNGKTEIGSVLGLYGLLRGAAQLVIGIASSAEQARLVYLRTMLAIASNPSLSKMFDRLTDTRGIVSKDGGRYELKAAKNSSLQGLPVDVGVVDELHLLKIALWTALVNGTGGRPNGLVVGITTAGDDLSELLIHLYAEGDKAIGVDPSENRFGFYVWEAPEARVPDDDAELLEFLKAANPALASGRLDAENVLSDVRSMPPTDVIRYRLNRFVASTTVFISADAWQRNERGFEDHFPTGLRPVIAVDLSPDWGYATITATVKDAEGFTWTEVVASIVKPSLAQLVDVCTRLGRHSPSVFAMDGYTLRPLADELKKRGLPVYVATLADVANASALTFAKIAQRKIRHAGDPLLSVQVPRTVRKNVGVGFRISRADSSVEIDAIMSTVLGVYVAETRSEVALQVF